MADQANTDLKASQTGIDPITGSILSPETRKLLFRRSQISSSSLFGGGKGSAIVPVNRGRPDPQTLAIVKAEETSIATLRQQINALVKRDDNFLAQVAQVTSIQQAQINGLSQTVIGLGAEFEAVRVSIINDSLLEQQKARQENEYEKQLAEQGLRQGKEKLLEQKIQNALMAPVRAIGNKVSGIFGNLMNFMWTLLGGWLTMQGLDTLKALATGDKKKLEDIKNNVIKSLLIVGGSLLFLQFGLGKLIGSITKLAFKASKFVLENTIGRLFKVLGDLAKKALGLGGKSAEGAAKAGVAGAEAAAKAGVAGAEGAAKGGAGLLKGIGGAILPIGGALLEGQMAKESADRGNTWAASLHGISAAFSASEASIIDIPFAWTGSLLTGLGGSLLDATGIGDTKKSPEKTPTKTTPKNKAIPSKTPTPAKTAPANMASITSGTGEPESTSTPPAAQTTPPAQTQSMPTPQQNLGQPTEPAPQVVTLNAPQTQGSQTPQSSLMPGSATDIPLFPSANPDNFYSLYAQVNYNVIL
jgi:hypothetical protein